MGYDDPTQEQVEAALKWLDPTAVTQVYRGKKGCCCGCLGNHYAGDELTKTRIANVVRDLRTADWSELAFSLDENGKGHICLERNDRYVIAYLRGA